MNKLEENIENISDDFHSTFTLAGRWTMINMLQGPHEFDELTAIIKKYVGDDIKVEYTKTNSLGSGTYDVYKIDLYGVNR